MQVRILYKDKHINNARGQREVFEPAEKLLSEYLTERGFDFDIDLIPEKGVHGSSKLKGASLAQFDASTSHCVINIQPGTNKTAWKYRVAYRKEMNWELLGRLVREFQSYSSGKLESASAKPSAPVQTVAPEPIQVPSAPAQKEIVPETAGPASSDTVKDSKPITPEEFLSEEVLIQLLLAEVAGSVFWFKPSTLVERLNQEFSHWSRANRIRMLNALSEQGYIALSSEREGMYELVADKFPESFFSATRQKKQAGTKKSSVSKANEEPPSVSSRAPMTLFKGEPSTTAPKEATPAPPAPQEKRTVVPLAESATANLASLEKKATHVEDARRLLKHEEEVRAKLDARLAEAVEVVESIRRDIASHEQLVRDAHSILANPEMTSAAANLQRLRKLKK